MKNVKVVMVATMVLLGVVSVGWAGSGIIQLNSGGQLNGQTVDASHYSINVNPGDPIMGTIKIGVRNDLPGSDVVPVATTVTWGDRTAQPWTVASNVNPGWTNLTVNVNKIAPMTPGTYYIAIAAQGEFTATNIMSGTNWAHSGGNIWNDGNDVGWDWDTTQFQDARNNGCETQQWLFGYGYDNDLVAANWVQVNVPEPATLSMLAFSGLALLRRRK
jgi:hypothetical protein